MKFDDRVEYRKKREKMLLNDSFQGISKAVVQHTIGEGLFEENGRSMKDAVSQLLVYFDVKEKELPSKLESLEERLDYLLASTGIFYREVRLEGEWYKDAMGAMIGSMKADGAVISILPGPYGGFVYVDPHTGRKKRINKKEAEKIGNEAYCFYRPLPMRKLTSIDIWKYMKACVTNWDLFSFCMAAIIITFLGLLIPKLNKLLMGDVVNYSSRTLLAAVMVYMLCITIGNRIFSVFDTGRNCSILIFRSSSVVNNFMIGG